MTSKRTAKRRRSTSGSSGRSSRHHASKPTTIPLSRVLIDPDLRLRYPTRLDKERDERCLYVTDLVASIKKDGQLQPITVTRDKKDPSCYVVIDGHRRVTALQQLGKKSVDAVTIAIKDADQALERAFTMNKVRKQLAPLDIAQAIVLAKRRGWPKSRIEKTFGVKRSRRYEYERLMKSPASVQRALEDNKISMAQALSILDAREKAADVQVLLDRCIEEDLSARRIKKEHSKKRRGGRRSSRRPLIDKQEDDRVSVRRFSASSSDKEHIRWLKGQLKKISTQLDKLLKQ